MRMEPGFVWVGTNTQGLFKLNTNTDFFQTTWQNESINMPVYALKGREITSMKKAGETRVVVQGKWRKNIKVHCG